MYSQSRIRRHWEMLKTYGLRFYIREVSYFIQEYLVTQWLIFRERIRTAEERERLNKALERSMAASREQGRRLKEFNLILIHFADLRDQYLSEPTPENRLIAYEYYYTSLEPRLQKYAPEFIDQYTPERWT